MYIKGLCPTIESRGSLGDLVSLIWSTSPEISHFSAFGLSYLA